MRVQSPISQPHHLFDLNTSGFPDHSHPKSSASPQHSEAEDSDYIDTQATFETELGESSTHTNLSLSCPSSLPDPTVDLPTVMFRPNPSSSKVGSCFEGDDFSLYLAEVTEYRLTYRWSFHVPGYCFFQMVNCLDPLFSAPIEVIAHQCADQQRAVASSYHLHLLRREIDDENERKEDYAKETQNRGEKSDDQMNPQQGEMLDEFDMQALVGTYLLLQGVVMGAAAMANTSSQKPASAQESKPIEGNSDSTDEPQKKQNSKKSKKSKKKKKAKTNQGAEKEVEKLSLTLPKANEDGSAEQTHVEAQTTHDTSSFETEEVSFRGEISKTPVDQSPIINHAESNFYQDIQNAVPAFSMGTDLEDHLREVDSLDEEKTPLVEMAKRKLPDRKLDLENNSESTIAPEAHHTASTMQSTSFNRDGPSKKGKSKAQSKSMTQIELKLYGHSANETTRELKKFTMADSPPSLEEARAKRKEEKTKARRDRSNSIKLLQERTSSRSSILKPSIAIAKEISEGSESLMESPVANIPLHEPSEPNTPSQEDWQLVKHLNKSRKSINSEIQEKVIEADTQTRAFPDTAQFCFQESEFPALYPSEKPTKAGEKHHYPIDDPARLLRQEIDSQSETHGKSGNSSESGKASDCTLSKPKPKLDSHFRTAVPLLLFTYGKPERILRAAKGAPISEPALQDLIAAAATRAEHIASLSRKEKQEHAREMVSKNASKAIDTSPKENERELIQTREGHDNDTNELKSNDQTKNGQTTNSPTHAQSMEHNPQVKQPQALPTGILDKIVWVDERMNPKSPNYMVPDRLRWYRTWEAEGHTVRVFSELKHTCTKEGCNEILFDNEDPKHGRPILCYGCGPHSSTRYCSFDHLLEDCTAHALICGLCPLPFPTDGTTMPEFMYVYYSFIHNKHGWVSKEYNRQRAFNVYKDDCDYAVFNDVEESERLGKEHHGSTFAKFLVHWDMKDPRKDRFNRLLNIAFYDHEIKGPAEYIYRCIRFTLRQAKHWSEAAKKELDRQFIFEFKALTSEFSDEDICLTDEVWEKEGLEKFCMDLESKVWLLRAWRSYHPTITDWIARAQGVGFTGTTDFDVRQRSQGRIFNGWGFEHSEVPGTANFVGFLEDGSI